MAAVTKLTIEVNLRRGQTDDDLNARYDAAYEEMLQAGAENDAQIRAILEGNA